MLKRYGMIMFFIATEFVVVLCASGCGGGSGFNSMFGNDKDTSRSVHINIKGADWVAFMEAPGRPWTVLCSKAPCNVDTTKQLSDPLKRFGLAYVCGSNVYIQNGSTDNANQYMGCGSADPATATAKIQGSFRSLPGGGTGVDAAFCGENQSKWLSLSTSWFSPASNTYSVNNTFSTGKLTLVADQSSLSGSIGPYRILVDKDINVVKNTNLNYFIDFAGPKAVSLGAQHKIAITGVETESHVIMYYLMKCKSINMTLAKGSNPNEWVYGEVPASVAEPGSSYALRTYENKTGASCSNPAYSRYLYGYINSGDVSIPIGSVPWPSEATVSATGGIYITIKVSYNGSTLSNVSGYSDGFLQIRWLSSSQFEMRWYSIRTDASWPGASTSISIPDFSGMDGWNPEKWSLKTPSSSAKISWHHDAYASIQSGGIPGMNSWVMRNITEGAIPTSTSCELAAGRPEMLDATRREFEKRMLSKLKAARIY